MPRRLKQWAQEERDEFDAAYENGGCSCHVSPPCGYCTHPGNPLNQEEDDSAWDIVFSTRTDVDGDLTEDFDLLTQDGAQAQRQMQADARLMNCFRQYNIPYDALDAALSDGANPNRMINGTPLLHLAIARKDMDVLKRLVSAGASLSDVDEHKLYTAYDYAYYKGFKEARQYFKLRGAPSNYADVEYGCEGMHKSNYQRRIDHYGLMCSAGFPEPVMLTRLLQLGLDPNVRDSYSGEPLFHRIVRGCDKEKVQTMIDAGADVNIRCRFGDTPLSVLWHARFDADRMLSDNWYDIAALLKASGSCDMFFQTPQDMSFEDLRQKPLNIRMSAPVMHYVAAAGQLDLIFEKLEKSPASRFMAQDFNQSSPLLNQGLSYAVIKEKGLRAIFNTKIWQDRTGEMIAVWDKLSPLSFIHDKTFTKEDLMREVVRENLLSTLAAKPGLRMKR